MNRLSSLLQHCTTSPKATSKIHLSLLPQDHLSILPQELLLIILSYLPPALSTNLRLTSTHFSTSQILFTHIFTPLLKTWLSEKESHRLISSTASDLINRPTAMWSPWAMEAKIDEDVEVAMSLGDSGPQEAKTAGELVFLQIIWKLLSGSEFEAANGAELGFKNLGVLSGREVFTEKRLRMGRSRFLLYRKLMREGEVDW